MHVTGVKVEDLKTLQLCHHLIQLHHLRDGGITHITGQAQRLRNTGIQLCTGARIAAGEQHHLVAPPHQFFGQVMHNPFGSPIALWGTTFMQRRDLSDAHDQGRQYSRTPQGGPDPRVKPARMSDAQACWREYEELSKKRRVVLDETLIQP